MSADFYAEYGGAQLAPTVNQNWNQVPDSADQCGHFTQRPARGTITHVVIPYTDIFPTAMPLFGATDGGQSLQAYWQLSYNPNGTSDDGMQTVFIDNVQLVRTAPGAGARNHRYAGPGRPDGIVILAETLRRWRNHSTLKHEISDTSPLVATRGLVLYGA